MGDNETAKRTHFTEVGSRVNQVVHNAHDNIPRPTRIRNTYDVRDETCRLLYFAYTLEIEAA